MSRRDLNRLAKKIAKEQARLAPLLPQIEAHDLGLILGRMFRPLDQQRFFIRRHRGMYVR